MKPSYPFKFAFSIIFSACVIFADNWTTSYTNYIASQTTTKVGIGFMNGSTPISTPCNLFDVKGSAAIGFHTAGLYIAPTDGLLIEGNVGIGTTAPGSYKLIVQGGYSGFKESAGTNGITIYPNHTGFNQINSDHWTGTTNLPLSFGTSTTQNAMVILDNGNVGIGKLILPAASQSTVLSGRKRLSSQ